MMNLVAILVLLLLVFECICLLFFLVSMTIDLVKILDIPAILNGTWWQKNISIDRDLTLEKFPIGEEHIFSGIYPSHWEIPRFRLMSIDCQLDIPIEGGWNWLVAGLENPTTRDGYSGTFNLEFRGKIVERGAFGHMGICCYRIEVIEILSVKQLIQ